MYQSKRKTSNENILKIGDVVIIKDDKIRSRNSWRIGLVESFFIGKDGKIRALLTTRTNNSRPVQKLIPLGIISDSCNIDSLNKEIINCDEHAEGTSDTNLVNPGNTLNDEISSCDEHTDVDSVAHNSFDENSHPRFRRNAAKKQVDALCVISDTFRGRGGCVIMELY